MKAFSVWNNNTYKKYNTWFFSFWNYCSHSSRAYSFDKLTHSNLYANNYVQILFICFFASVWMIKLSFLLEINGKNNDRIMTGYIRSLIFCRFDKPIVSPCVFEWIHVWNKDNMKIGEKYNTKTEYTHNI